MDAFGGLEMRGGLGKVCLHVASCCMAIASFALAGCASLTGQPFGSQGPRHPILESAKSISQTAAGIQPLPRELDKRVLAPYVVEPGDVLLLVASDMETPVRLPGDQPVLPDGTINLGRFGRVQVSGKTVDEIEAIVRAAVQAQTPGKDVGLINVRLMTRVSKVYYVIGEVNSPGSFQLSGRETVLDGIIAAGGLTDRASLANIILSRPTRPDSCRIVLPICLRQIVQLGDTTTNYQLVPGDRIFVASKKHWEHMFRSPKDDCLCSGPQFPCPAAEGGPGCAVNQARPNQQPFMGSYASPHELFPISKPAQ